MLQLEQEVGLHARPLDLAAIFGGERTVTTLRREAPPKVEPRHRWYLPWKAVLEFVASTMLLVVALPIMALAAVLIRLTSKGPAVYTQIRVGKQGQPFAIYKLRTMYHDCEKLTGPVWASENDPRITPLGNFLRLTHIDELPQLWNVLRGEMSLIGPRPERPEFVTKLEREIPGYRLRLEVRPGITGLAQIHQAPDSSIDSVRRKLDFDLRYIETMTPWLDFHIVWVTLWSAVGFKWYQDEQQSPQVLPLPKPKTLNMPAQVELRKAA